MKEISHGSGAAITLSENEVKVILLTHLRACAGTHNSLATLPAEIKYLKLSLNNGELVLEWTWPDLVQVEQPQGLCAHQWDWQPTTWTYFCEKCKAHREFEDDL